MTVTRTAQVEVIATDELGDRSYLVHDGEQAVVVDPQRDVDRILEPLERLGLRLAAVCETHIHNDYLSGGLSLARATGARYLVGRDERVDFERIAVRHGDCTNVGGFDLRVIATPGHTATHLSYVVEIGRRPAAVFTGGSLLFGSVGRTDLDPTATAVELAHHQHRSAHELARLLPDETAVYPTHGFGSFCSAGGAARADTSTIGDERTNNPALLEADASVFATRLVAGFGDFPSYYSRMAERNRAGVEPPDLTPPPVVDGAELRRRVAAGEWVVDLRSRREFANEHLEGTINVELGQMFTTWLGWILPADAPLTLLAPTIDDVAAAQRQLVRIGVERPAGAAIGSVHDIGGVDAITASYPVARFGDLPVNAGSDGIGVLDVRRSEELGNGVVAGARHIPLHRLAEDAAQLPRRRWWVYCGSGLRAATATSLLTRAGHDVVLIDDAFSHAVELGLTS